MNTYQLWVNTSNDPTHENWQQIDTGNEVIAMTYQANDIAELKDRFADRSNNIKLPLSPNNNRILQFAAQVNSATYIPYQKLPCRLLVNGIEIVGRGSGCLVISRVSKHYECTIYGGTFNFFTALKDRKLNTTKFKRDTNAWNAVDYRNDVTENVIFPVMDWGSGINITTKVVDPKVLRPCAKVHYILQAICENQGYELDVDSAILHSPSYINAAIPLRPNTGNEPETYAYLDSQINPANMEFKFDYYPPLNGPGFWGDPNLPSLMYYAYYPGGGKKITFNVEIDVKVHSSMFLHYDIHGAGSSTLLETGKINTIRGTHVIDLSDQEASTTLEHLFFTISPAIPYRIEEIEIRIMAYQTQTEGTPINYRNNFSVGTSLPNLSQLDFFKGICQLYGAIVQADHEQRKISMYSYKSVYEKIDPEDKSKPIYFKDWSDKLDTNSHELSFKLKSYGQKNTIKYKENDAGDKLKLTSEGFFTVNDTTLEPEKKLFEPPFVALHDKELFGNNIARLYPKDDGTFPVHIINIFKVNDSGVRVNGLNISEDYTVFGNFTLLQMQSLINEHYDHLSNRMLDRAKLIVEKFCLLPTDVMAFEHSIPVWLAKYNAFFYVNKIENYQHGKLSKVELVRM